MINLQCFVYSIHLRSVKQGPLQFPAFLDERREIGSIWIGRQHSARCEIQEEQQAHPRGLTLCSVC